MMTEKCYVLIVAAGRSERMKSPLPKQYMNIDGKPLLRRTVEIFSGLTFVDEIRIVINRSHADIYKNACNGLDVPGPVYGGTSRQESVYNGLASLNARPDDIILIHDAARPLTRPDDIEKLYRYVKEYGPSALACRSRYTLVKADESSMVKNRIERGCVWEIHTPQGFRYETIMQAHRKARGQEYTDDTALMDHAGERVKLIECSRDNIKITSPEDFRMAEKILSDCMDVRTGTGFDVHKFSNNRPGPLRLCGTEIVHDYALEGHSDADAALHALADALFGAAGEHDIGFHFPPSDNKWKDCDSSVFVMKARELIESGGGSILNADITIICELPKVAPYRDEMRLKTAELLGIDVSRTNIKATTTEGLGFTGRGEGIAVQACVSVELPK